MKKLLFFVLLVCISNTAIAVPELPHLEIVKKYMQSPDAYNAKITSCKGIYLMLGDDVECWAVHTAKSMSAEPNDTQKLILSKPKLEAALSKCRAMSMKEQFESRECAAAGQARNFISLRLPRMKLEPVKFK